jgi:hypothetical protein
LTDRSGPLRDLLRDRAFLWGVALVAVAGVVYWVCNFRYDAGHADFFYLARSFVEGRVWLDAAARAHVGPWDVLEVGGRYYVPFAPFPAILFMPLALVFDPVVLDNWEAAINAVLAASTLGLCWVLLGRIGVPRLVDRFALVVLLGFSTQLWWVTTRGGVWHTGHIIATGLTLLALIEVWGRQRPVVIGLLAGAAFLTRAPLAFALPFYALMLERRWDVPAPATAGAFVRRLAARWPIREWAVLVLAFGVSVAFFLWYNYARFGSILESGYGLAALPEFLQRQRDLGLFSLAHVRMNIDYFLLKVPQRIDEFPFFRPDTLGMSVLITSPGLLLAFFAPWRNPRAWWLAGAAIAVLIPTLLYYGGGWLQYGYRYFLDSIPFVVALCAMAVAKRGALSGFWKLVIGFGVLVGLGGVYWAYNI